VTYVFWTTLYTGGVYSEEEDRAVNV